MTSCRAVRKQTSQAPSSAGASGRRATVRTAVNGPAPLAREARSSSGGSRSSAPAIGRCANAHSLARYASRIRVSVPDEPAAVGDQQRDGERGAGQDQGEGDQRGRRPAARRRSRTATQAAEQHQQRRGDDGQAQAAAQRLDRCGREHLRGSGPGSSSPASAGRPSARVIDDSTRAASGSAMVRSEVAAQREGLGPPHRPPSRRRLQRPARRPAGSTGAGGRAARRPGPRRRRRGGRAAARASPPRGRTPGRRRWRGRRRSGWSRC